MHSGPYFPTCSRLRSGEPSIYLWQVVQRLIAIFAGGDIKESDAETSEEAKTNLDKERTLTPSFFVAVSSLSKVSLAGAENECLRRGDLSQEG